VDANGKNHHENWDEEGEGMKVQMLHPSPAPPHSLLEMKCPLKSAKCKVIGGGKEGNRQWGHGIGREKEAG
jgi:hypothetical protein